EAKGGTVLGQHLEYIGVGFEGDNPALRKQAFEIEDTQAHIGPAIDDQGRRFPRVKAIDLLLADGVILGQKRLAVHERKTAARQGRRRSGVAWQALEPFNFSLPLPVAAESGVSGQPAALSQRLWNH